jgi:translation initiation factor IF-3
MFSGDTSCIYLKDIIHINHQIRSKELRVLTDDGENFGVLSLQAALTKAEELGLDLIEISPNAIPPVAKIMDYGKYQYIQQKREKEARAKSHITETKSLQVKIGTGDKDLEIKAKKASEFLKDGHRVKIDLFLPGRSKYLNFQFLQERLDRILRLITEDYKVADSAKKSPKGLTMIIERQVKKAVSNDELPN